MSTVGLALASLLSFSPDAPVEPPPDPATEAPVIVVTPAPEPPPPSVPDWGPQADVVVSVSSAPRPRPIAPPPRPFAPPRKPMMGVGLLVGGAVAFGVGLTSRVGQVDVAMNNCRGWQDSGFNNLTQCFDYFDAPGLDANDLFVGAAYGSSMVVTMVGAGALGQYQAWQSLYGDMKSRNPMSRYVFGAIFTGLGIASIGAHYALIYVDAKNPCLSWECNVERRALWIAASDGGALLLNTGFGMFSWAGNYRSNLDRYKKMQWAVLPGVTPGSVGASASLRF
ncbi:MAG TPA: hypothetical protein VK034_20735 [Enhygromyxa sp.]|nr:hypothetical protein [Enhygromyxa sp.]